MAALETILFGFLLIMMAVIGPAPNAIAQVGERSFFEPLITADPNPGNTLDIVPQWTGIEHGNVASVAFSLEKRLAPNFSIQIGDAWNDPMCATNQLCDNVGARRRGGAGQNETDTTTQSAASSGMDDIEILTKYAFEKSDDHEMRLAIGTDMFIPAGHPDAGADTFFFGGPILMLAKGMGDLPHKGAVRFMRPLALQADLEYLFESGGNEANSLGADWVVSYPFEYLNCHVEDFGWPSYLVALTPFVEFTYNQSVVARRVTTQPDLRMLPGLAYVADNWQLSLATTFAVHDATISGNHAGVIGMLSVTLSDWPKIDGYPIFGWQIWKTPRPWEEPACCTQGGGDSSGSRTGLLN